MKKILLFAITIAILLSLNSAHAQNQTQARIDMAIATLQQYTNRIPGMLQKVVDCSLGRTTCTQAEITQTRVILSTVSAAITVLALAIGGVIAKQKGVWPFTPSTAPVPLLSPSSTTSGTPVPTTVTVPATTRVAMTDEENDLAKEAIYHLNRLNLLQNNHKELTQNQELMSNSFNTLNRLIKEGKLNPKDSSGYGKSREGKFEGTMLPILIEELLKLANDLYHFE